MLRFICAALLLGTAAGAQLIASRAPAADIIPGEYIAVLQRNTTVALHTGVASRIGGTPIRIGAFSAVSGRLDLARALADAAVAYVEHNEVVRADGGRPPHPHPHPHPVHPTRVCPDMQASGASWGQTRTTVRTAAELDPLGQYRHDQSWGKGVDAYVIDTGVYCEHNELQGHCEWGLTVTGTPGDRNGHGTHVAGTIAGATYGVAKATHIIAVKVLGDNALGTKDGVIRGTEWAAAEAKRRGRKGVANLSLGGEFSQAENDAMDAAVDEGLPVAISAGNGNNDACNLSPASAPKAITVMSSESMATYPRSDRRSSFSSYGSCTDIIAPGSGILSAYIGSPTATSTMSGTSMAAPHVAGVVAQFLSLEPGATPPEVKAHLTATALTNIVDLRCTTAACHDSPDALLHIAC